MKECFPHPQKCWKQNADSQITRIGQRIANIHRERLIRRENRHERKFLGNVRQSFAGERCLLGRAVTPGSSHSTARVQILEVSRAWVDHIFGLSGFELFLQFFRVAPMFLTDFFQPFLALFPLSAGEILHGQAIVEWLRLHAADGRFFQRSRPNSR